MIPAESNAIVLLKFILLPLFPFYRGPFLCRIFSFYLSALLLCFVLHVYIYGELSGYKILITRGGDRRHEQTSDSGNTRSAAA